jgi:hypothetical protein
MAAVRLLGQQTKALRKAEVASSVEPLDVGVVVRKDSLPGTGWVLERFGKRDRFYGTKDVAIGCYWDLVARGEG